MKYTVFDKETNGLLDKVTFIRCIGYADYEDGVLLSKGVLTTEQEWRNFYATREILVGHNIILYDIEVARKLLGINYTGRCIDTLAISWYMFPIKGYKHGLGAYGERLGFPKPPIEDWDNLPAEVYIERVKADVEINSRLFHEQLKYLKELYGHGGDLNKLFTYLSFKMDCLSEQQQNGINLDIDLCNNTKAEIDILIEDKVIILSAEMPKVVIKTIPKKMYKIDGTLSKIGDKWLDLLQELGLPEGTQEIHELGNPGSDKQLKEWLSILGWQPITFKVSKATKQNLPQVSLPFGAGICPSTKNMYEEYPKLEELENLYMLRHRSGLFKSFLTAVNSEGKVFAKAQGFTNTMRLKHSKPVANLPKVGVPYGKQIRGAFIVPDDNHIMVGSDVSGLEDSTKRHYIYFYDPKYVDDMSVPGFDAHIDIGVLAGMLNKDDEQFFKDIEANIEIDKDYLLSQTQEVKDRYSVIKKIRFSAKTVNFSCVYGAGPAKISIVLKSDLAFAKKLHTIYWSRNRAVKKTADACTVIKVKGQKWLYNPISGLWMFLKAEKDRFSTLNQSSGVFVFDTWVMKVREKLKPYGIAILLQYHDEIMSVFAKGSENTVGAILRQCMQEVNADLKLNVEIKISVQYGKDYGECH